MKIEQINLKEIEPRTIITDKNYYTDTSHITNSMLSILHSEGPKSLSDYLDKVYARKEESYFVFGEAVHQYILEPKEFGNNFCCLKKSDLPFPESTMVKRENKAYKEEFALANEGKKILSEADMKKIINMRESLFRIDECYNLIKSCEVEKIYLGEYDNIRLKCKVDGINKEDDYLIDIKTTSNANPDIFREKCNDFGYYRQAAMYTHLTGISNYYIIAIDKTFPHNIGKYRISKITIDKGWDEVKQLFKVYKKYFGENFDRGAINNFHFEDVL
jgi:hypothetical protein